MTKEERKAMWREAYELEGRLFGGAYDASRLVRAARDAPIREMISKGRARYNELRKEFGLSAVREWDSRPAQLVQHTKPD